MDSSVTSATGWHRKWLLLCAAVVWLYFLRFRVLGWALSQCATLALRFKLPQLHARVQIHHLTLRPLELGHVDISGGKNAWRVVWTRVRVETHVADFFRSFVQKKILVVAVDDVFVDLLEPDDQLLRTFHVGEPTATGCETATLHHADEGKHSMGFMRFIDLRVRSISVNIEFLETRTRFRCSDLRVDILEVMVTQNLLHLSLSVSSLFLASRPLQQPSPLSGSTPRRRDGGAAGLGCELTNTQIVLDVRLTDQEIIGCTVASNGDEPAYLHVDTAYVELLLTKKRDQVRKGRYPIPQWMWHQGDVRHNAHEVPSASPFTLHVADFPLVMDVVHSGGGGRGKMPLQVVTHIRQLTFAKNQSLESHGEPIEPAATTVKMPVRKDHVGVNMRLECQTIQLSSGVDFSHRVLSLMSCRIEMDRDSASHGRLQCEIRDAQLAVNPSVCEVLHSLALFPDTIDAYERTTELLMWERVAQRLGQPALIPKARVPVQWVMSVEVHDWSLQAWLGSCADGWGKRDLEAQGKRTTLRSTISPQPSGRAMKHQVDLCEAYVQVSLHGVESADKGKDYSVQFGSVSVLTSMQTTPHSKSMELKLSSSSVVLNGHVKGLGLHGSGDLPGLVVSNAVFHQTETESDEITQVSISLVTTDADFVTSHFQHGEIMDNLRVMASIMDQVRIMLTPPDAADRISTPMKETAKALGVNVRASSMRGQLLDVDSVSPVVEVAINEMKAVYQKAAAASTTTTTVTCAFLKMLWESDPVMDLANVRFHQTVTSSLMPRSGEIRCEGDVISSSEISLSHLQLWLLPERRLLLLFLRLDELANASNNKSEMTISTTPSSPQHVTFHCTKMGIQLRSLLADSGGTSPHSIHLDHVTVQADLTKSGKMTEAMLRYLQLTHRHESCRARLADALQVVEMDGTLGVQSLNVVSDGDSVFCVNEWAVRFATTDTSVSDGDAHVDQQASSPHYIPSKITLFDVSSIATQIKLTLSRDTKTAANVMLSILQTALEAQPRTVGSDPLVDDPVPDWRLRFVGSLDCGFQRLVVVLPFTGDGSETRSMVACADQLTLHGRQFQKLWVQFELLRVAITDHDVENDSGLGSDSASIGRSALGNDHTDLMPLELLYLPRTKLDAAIHWKALSLGSPERFAVSFDLVLRSHPSCSSDQLPFVGEALCCLNWDCVFPALAHLMAEDPEAATVATNSDTRKAVECVGIQWNVSVDVVQLVAWDAMTHSDSAMLLVAQDLLSHGVARLHATGTSPPRWVLWETTVYLDLFRAYLLRDTVTKGESSTRACGGKLPFQRCDQSSFFIESSGTSYRATHDGSGGDDAERAAAAETSGLLFGELAFAMVEKLHDQFTRVEYAFAERAVGAAVPVTTTGSSPSPPKSPRAWTQSVRSKLARLKRRTSSMDNMLLNDGSRPIQVDSMKLLWTITTRDSAFHMIAAIGDCIEAVVEITRRQESTASVSEACSVRPLSPRETARASKDPFDASERQAKRTDTPSFDATRMGRRVSTRDSLLELLQQGKLGNKDTTASVHSHSETHSPPPSRTPRTANEEMQHLSKTIHLKTYTLDVHDVQISILDETSRSSALIASKHIHLEAGHDETEATAIVTLKFEGVTGHVAPLDVEVASGVIWYSQPRTVGVGSQRMPTGQALLKQVMDEFTLTTTYSQGIASGETSVEVDMSSLQLSTDRSQFYQLLNVLRHVLLAPPTIMLRTKRQPTAHRNHDHVHASGTMGLVADDTLTTASPPSASTLPVYTGKKLHAQLVEELRIRDAKTLGVSRSAQTLLKLISFRSAGGVIRLRTSPESVSGDYEFVEIRAEGITGSHAFFASQNTKLVLTLQWMEINNLRPGPSSIAFEDAMAVLKATLLVDPRLPQSSHERTSLSTTNQKGMLTVRAESGPLTRVLGQKLRILDVLEISVFPEVPNMIVIQLAADFYDLLYKFFFEQVSSSGETHQETANGEQLLFGKRSVSSASAAAPLSPTTTTTHKSRAYTSPASPPHTLMGRRRSTQTSASMGADSAITASTVSTPSGDPLVVIGDDDDASADGCELFYFKYVRIGNVRLRINCHGFFVNLSHFDLDLPPFVTQSRLCTWNKLLQKFESHLRWYVTKETASTGLSHFKNKLLKWTPTNSASSGASSDKKDHKHKRGTGDDSSSSATAMNAHVLFGPYSGSS